MKIKLLVDVGKGFEERELSYSVVNIIKKLLSLTPRKEPIKRVSKEKVKVSTLETLTILSKTYPEILVYYHYFNSYKSRNDYYIIMKHSVICNLKRKKAHDERFTHTLIGLVVNLDHSTVSTNLNKDVKQLHPDYNEVVVIMDKMIKDGKYPYPVVNRKTVRNEHLYTSTQYEWK